MNTPENTLKVINDWIKDNIRTNEVISAFHGCQYDTIIKYQGIEKNRYYECKVEIDNNLLNLLSDVLIRDMVTEIIEGYRKTSRRE